MREVEIREVMGDELAPAITLKPVPIVAPVALAKSLSHHIRPSDVVAAVIRRDVDPVRLVVRGDNHATEVQDRIGLTELHIHGEHVGWRGNVGLQVLIKLVAIVLAAIVPLADAQDH